MARANGRVASAWTHAVWPMSWQQLRATWSLKSYVRKPAKPALPLVSHTIAMTMKAKTAHGIHIEATNLCRGGG